MAKKKKRRTSGEDDELVLPEHRDPETGEVYSTAQVPGYTDVPYGQAVTIPGVPPQKIRRIPSFEGFDETDSYKMRDVQIKALEKRLKNKKI